MYDKNFDIRKMFNEPEFKVNPEKYIERLKKLLGDANKSIKSLEIEVEKQEGVLKVFIMSQIVMSEYFRDMIKQMISALEFSSR